MEELRIQGFHVYQDNWTPIFGKQLVKMHEPVSPMDRYAVGICKGIFPEIFRPILTMSLIFIGHCGITYCEVSEPGPL